ncbi:hypothetical protein [Chryseobacterium sp. CH21]|uniref:hypothetical protein n=1 Tax=Chryseobacterium sp. CH21 TaxID=713556 RepID=UPI00100BFC24|nr:hypothetical protein [Chryseobacterium sp. CH21]
MIQIILMLLGLAFPNDNANTANDNTPPTTITTLSAESGTDSDTGGETGTTLPPKNKYFDHSFRVVFFILVKCYEIYSFPFSLFISLHHAKKRLKRTLIS